jgi:transposase
MNKHHPNRALSQKEMEARRLRAVPYFKKEWSERKIGSKLGVSGPTVHEWKVFWKKKGIAGLKAGVYGRVSRLSKQEEKLVRKQILKGAGAFGFSGDFWTLKRLSISVRRWVKVDYKDRSIWHVLKRLGFSCQKPARRARERDEKAITTWMTTTWPVIKKGA